MTRLFGDIPANEAGWPNGAPGDGGSSGAPTTADYLVKTADAGLSAERVVGDSTSITADWATPGAVNFQRAALTGDVIASANSNTTTIGNGVVSLAKMADLLTDSLIGRDTAGTGVPERIGVTGGIQFDGSGNIRTTAFTGEVTKTAGGTVLTIANGAVVFARIQDLAASSLIGRISGSGSGVSSNITLGSGLAISPGGVLDVKPAGIVFSMIQDLAASSLIGRRSGAGSGVSENVTLTSAFSMSAAGVLDIAAAGLALSKLQNLVATSLIGRISGSGTGAPSNITLDSTLTISPAGVMGVIGTAGSAGGDLTGTYPNPTIKASVVLTTPNIGAATGTSLAATGAVTSSGTAGIGYAAGAGGTVTQATSKSTGVTLNKICGQITMNSAALAAAAEISFTLTNSTIAATDVVVVCVASAATAATYAVSVDAVAAGSCRISVSNWSTTSRSEAIVLNFVVIKAVTS